MRHKPGVISDSTAAARYYIRKVKIAGRVIPCPNGFTKPVRIGLHPPTMLDSNGVSCFLPPTQTRQRRPFCNKPVLKPHCRSLNGFGEPCSLHSEIYRIFRTVFPPFPPRQFSLQ